MAVFEMVGMARASYCAARSVRYCFATVIVVAMWIQGYGEFH